MFAALLIALMATGEVRSDLATAADAGQHYDLFLPANYPGNRRWPVLIVLDPRGRADSSLRMAQPGASANGWLVLSSRQSRSDDREQLTLSALQALLREAGTRYAIDPARVYVAGMSGTAKSLWIAEESLRGLVAGYVGAGGGRPPELGRITRKPPPFFGFAGNHDFNFQEMRALDAALAKAGTAHRLDIFAGPHGWPPEAAQFAAAIDWLELAAMREGRAAKREDFIDAQLASARAGVAAAASATERWRRTGQLLRDFDGLRGLGGERDEAARLGASPEVRAQLKLEARLAEEEARFARGLDEWATRLRQAKSPDGTRLPPPDLARTLATLRIDSVRKRSEDADALVADSAIRRLDLAFAAGAHYLADEQQRRGDPERTKLALKLAAAIYPAHPYPACRLRGLAATPRQALAEAVAACGSTPAVPLR